MLPKLLPALNSNTVTLRINKAAFTLGAWGLLILLASLVNQFFIPPSLEAVYALWSAVTLLGILAQAICLARGLGTNFAVWIVVMVIGWLFTHSGFYADIPGVWLILLGVGYVATAFQIHMRFMWLAGLHLAVGALMELAAHNIVSFPLLVSYASLVFGLVAGLPLVIGVLPVWYRPRQPAANPAPARAAVGNEPVAQAGHPGQAGGQAKAN
jgi:hypothetical protein